jgi:hypothetical protein
MLWLARLAGMGAGTVRLAVPVVVLMNAHPLPCLSHHFFMNCISGSHSSISQMPVSHKHLIITNCPVYMTGAALFLGFLRYNNRGLYFLYDASLSGNVTDFHHV